MSISYVSDMYTSSVHMDLYTEHIVDHLDVYYISLQILSVD